MVSLTDGRPSAKNFSYADTLKSFMKATDVRIRLLRTKTLLGHLMAKARQDPTVTRRVGCLIFDGHLALDKVLFTAKQY